MRRPKQWLAACAVRAATTATRVVLAGALAPVSLAAAPPPDGAALYARHCLACHGPGNDKPGTVALQMKYAGSVPAVLDQRRDLQPAFIRTVLRHGINIMPWYRRTELDDAAVDAIAAYLTTTR